MDDRTLAPELRGLLALADELVRDIDHLTRHCQDTRTPPSSRAVDALTTRVRSLRLTTNA